MTKLFRLTAALLAASVVFIPVQAEEPDWVETSNSYATMVLRGLAAMVGETLS